MGLLEQVKDRNLRRKAKRPLRPTGYSTVSAIVSRYGLREDFIGRLDSLPEFPHENGFIREPLKRKSPLDALPFPVSDSRQYQVTKKILDAADNPYLAFASSPDEIILSRHLFDLNPSISPQLLAAHDFETLLLVELAKSRIEELFGETAPDDAPVTGSRKAAQTAKPTGETDYPSGPDVLPERVRALREFILSVENPNGITGEKCPEN